MLSCIIRARGSPFILVLIRSHAREVLCVCAREGSTFPYRGSDRPKNADLSLTPGPDHGAAGGVQIVKMPVPRPWPVDPKNQNRRRRWIRYLERGKISIAGGSHAGKTGAPNKSRPAGWTKSLFSFHVIHLFFLVDLQRTAAGLLYPGLFLCLFQIFQR